MNLKKVLVLILSFIATILSVKAESKAKFGYMLFEPETEWTVQDSIIRIGINFGEGGDFQKLIPIGCISFFNKTEDVIYVDLSQCFISRNLKSQALWDNTQLVKSVGGSTGGSINLGAITNAVGVGGVVGSLASGINVGSNSSSSTSTITQAEKIVAIAPHSEHTITVPLLPADFALPNFKIRKTTGWNMNRIDGATLVLTDLFAGQIINYTKDSSPIRISFFVKYSDTPEFITPRKQTLNFYVKELIGTKKAWWDGKNAKKELEKYGKGEVNAFVHSMHFYVDKNW